MATYTLFLDQWNAPPDFYRNENIIIGRCIDEAIEMSKAIRPDKIVFGNSYFEEDFIDWMVENRLEVPVDFVGGSETDHRTKVAHLKV